MLNRHFLRSKVLQSLYAYTVDADTDEKTCEKDLFDNIGKMYNLEIYLLSTLLEIRDIAEQQMEDAKNKFFPTEQEANPSLRFIDNRFFLLLEKNTDLRQGMEQMKLSWAEHRDIMKNIYLRFAKSNAYSEYMEKESVGFEDDRQVVMQLYKNYIVKNEALYDILIEKCVSWESDFDCVAEVVRVLVKNWTDDETDRALPYPFTKDEANESETDREFVKNLLRNTIAHSEEYEPYIKKRSENWDRDRLALIDVIIIKMAMSEFIYTPSVPVRVTLNEYIELAKEFSTEKSRLFVNGILDRLILDLRMEGKIVKEEREEK